MPEATLLVEIGCEELPARQVRQLAEGFGTGLQRRLAEAQLIDKGQQAQAQWTPRRLIVVQAGVRERQPMSEEEVLGPPARLCFGADGAPTAQALGFAAKNGAAAGELYRVQTAKGEYVALKRKVGGGAAAALLAGIIPEAFGALELPRSMRWDGGMRFLRPVRWALALLGDRAISFRLGEIESGTESRGHRTLGAARFGVATAAEFPGKWQANGVTADPQARRQAIADAIQLPAGMRTRKDAELERMLVNLTEHPDAIVGSFDAAYLSSLPEEVLVTVMRDHQKYFAVEDAQGRLAPYFIAVTNQKGDPKGLIRHGNERVLRARFADARFFFDTDRKLTLAERLPLLEQVTFHAKLGSYREKSRRIRDLAAWLAELWGADRAAASEAAELAKCDLTTEMVKEFTELQGIMGGHYARLEGKSAEISEAIADQYSWEIPPRSKVGAAVGVADKLDTIAGMFSIGDIPTGSADPFALRRQANGVVRIVVESKLHLRLSEAWTKTGFAAAAGLPEFFKERMSFYLREAAGFTPNFVNAVLAAGADDALDAFERCRALAAAPDLAAVGAVIKRARNIVRKENWKETVSDAASLGAPAEKALQQAVAALTEDAGYEAELAAIAQLAAPMEQFFNNVRVNDPDPKLRAARLSLLGATVQRLSRIADFAEL